MIKTLKIEGQGSGCLGRAQHRGTGSPWTAAQTSGGRVRPARVRRPRWGPARPVPRDRKESGRLPKSAVPSVPQPVTPENSRTAAAGNCSWQLQRKGKITELQGRARTPAHALGFSGQPEQENLAPPGPQQPGVEVRGPRAGAPGSPSIPCVLPPARLGTRAHLAFSPPVSETLLLSPPLSSLSPSISDFSKVP
jgi:hypothetical protein